MALMTRYNPPPNWPTPPPGWSPPTGWQPDPSWGPPPDGWPIWVQEPANPKAWLWSFVAAGTFYGTLLAIVFIATAGNVNSRTAGEFLFPFLLGAVVVGAIGWSRPRRWSIGMYFLLVFAVFVGVRFLTVLGQLGGS
jgi:hypothetical protein